MIKFRELSLFLAFTIIAVPLLLVGSLPAAAQQEISDEEIVRSLTAERPGQMSAIEIDDQKSAEALLNDLPNLTTIDPVIIGRIRKRISVHYVPTVDLAVYFEYDSAEITDRARRTLDFLGMALRRPILEGSTVVLAGHTDATGNFDYNRDLSQRRAAAVKAYLVSQFQIPPSLLVNVGVGELFLKDKQHPASGINRRVQIMNLGR
jgi:outer membrane protein OmpA-like peptidoglycan-associated protein